MISGRSRWMASAVIFLFVAGIALAFPSFQLVSGPTVNAQVGVPYSSAITAAGGALPYTFAIVSGGLPPGLTLSNTTTGAITGTPTTSGQYLFTASIRDSTLSDALPSAGPDSAAARRRTLAQSGRNADSITSPVMSITVAPAAPSATPVPPSVWMAMTGLAGAGLFRLRQKRRG
jgi:hypothetical protein